MSWRQWLRSFQARSIAASMVVCLLVWGGWSIWSLLEARLEHSQRYDREMRINAEIIVKSFPNVETKDSEPTNFEIPGLTDPISLAYEFNFQLWSQDRKLVARASTTPTEPLNPAFTPGYSNRNLNGNVWRVYVLNDANGMIQVQVGQTVAQRAAMAELEIREGLFGLLWLLGPLALGLVVVGLWTAQPLRKLRDSVAARRPDDDGPLSDTGLPSETVPLVKAFNDLLKRAAQAREAQQRFISDAAHELRTPLAVLRVQAQVAQRTRDEAQRAAALARLIEGIERATRVTEQLLDLARMDSMPASDPALLAETVDLPALVARAVEATHAIATQRRVALQTCVAPASTNGNAELLCIALRNVIDNALRYSPPQSKIEVKVSWQAGAIHLSVADRGPGLNAEEKLQVMQPFVRLGVSEEIGSGLGLSIVQRICALQGVRFELLDRLPGPGLLARFILKAEAPDF